MKFTLVEHNPVLCDQSGVPKISEAMKTFSQRLPRAITFFGDSETSFENATVKVLSAPKYLEIRKKNYEGEDPTTKLTVAALRCSRSLRTLNVSDSTCNFAPKNVSAMARAIAKNRVLEKFWLSGHTEAGESLRAEAELVRYNRSLRSLVLHGLNIDDINAPTFPDMSEVMGALAENRSLEVLHISLWRSGDAAVGDAAVFAIARMLTINEKIKQLGLINTRCTTEEVTAIARAIKLNPSTKLQELSLYGSYIGDAGAVELAMMLNANTTLSCLTLGCGGIGNIGIQALARVLKTGNKTLKSLDLSSNSCTNIEELADALRCNKSALEVLDLSFCKISDAALLELIKALESNSILRIIDICGHMINDEVARAILEMLKKNHTITDIVLSDIRIDYDYTLLAKIDQLLNRNRLQEIVRMLLALTHFSVLYFGNDWQIVNTMRKLVENDCTVAVVNSGWLDKREIRRAMFWLDARISSCDDLSPSCTAVIASFVLDDEGIAAIAEALKNNRTLKTLDLGSSSFGMKGMRALLDMLAENHTIMKINFDRDQLQSGADWTTCKDVLEQMLEERKSQAQPEICPGAKV